MSKTLDWNAVAKVNFDDHRRKANGQLTGKELFQKANERRVAEEEYKNYRAQVEPVLKASLIEHMSSRTPIKVMQPIQNPTETLGGLTKSEEDDGFYNSSPSMAAEAALSKRYQEVMETIPAGIELVYKSWDKQMGQWIFKGSNGVEYAIYDKSSIIFMDSQMENPGLYGLLYNTSIAKVLGEQ